MVTVTLPDWIVGKLPLLPAVEIAPKPMVPLALVADAPPPPPIDCAMIAAVLRPKVVTLA